MVKRIFPHFFVFCTFCLTFGLGVWQVDRLLWKEELVEKLNQRINKPPIAPADFSDIDKQEFRQMQAFGTFDHEREMKVLMQSYNGKVGEHIITPFVSDDGVTVLVNRGWVPNEDTNYDKPQERTKLLGVVRKNPRKGSFSLTNESGKNIWYNIELPQMYAKANTKTLPFYVEEIFVDETNPDAHDKAYPIALPKKVDVYNAHMQYIITWFGISIALLVMYYFRFWRNKPSDAK